MKHRSAGYALGELLEGSVERIVPGGFGLVRGSKGIVFVDGASPGDTLLIQIEAVKSGAPRGVILEILSPGPDRIDPPCPWYGTCGGCNFQHLSYPAQIDAKRQIVEDALRRIGGIELPDKMTVFDAPRPFGSRARIELHADRERHQTGFYARRSRRIVPVEHCMVSRDEVNSGLQSIRRSEQPYPASIHLLGANGEAHSHPPVPPVPGGSFLISVNAFEYLIDPGSFFQSSMDLLPALVDRVVDSMPEGGRKAWDLYCGSGLFTLPLSRRFQQVRGIEVDGNAIENARKSAERNQVGNALFTALDVTSWVSRQRWGGERPDLIVVDPPRSGLDRRLTELLAVRGIDRLTYVSCDPTTLARDLRVLTRNGHRILDVAIFDLFPQTHHVETVVRLAAN